MRMVKSAGSMWRLSVRATDQPLTKERWLRELLEFSWTANGETPWSPQQIRKFLDTAHPDDLPEVLQATQRLLQEGEPFVLVHRVVVRSSVETRARFCHGSTTATFTSSLPAAVSSCQSHVCP